MGKSGWLTMRNVPCNKEHNFVHVRNFFETHCLCPKCKGKGARFPEGEREMLAEATIRYQGVEDLETLAALEGIVLGDVVRDILEREAWGKRICGLCKGWRFVTIEAAKEWKMQRKAK